MVKLTGMYTLPEGADHEAFLKWRTTKHQKENMGIPGIIKSDFYAIREIYVHESGAIAAEQMPRSTDTSRDAAPVHKDRLKAQPLSYRYVTEAYWQDMQSFH